MGFVAVSWSCSQLLLVSLCVQLCQRPLIDSECAQHIISCSERFAAAASGALEQQRDALLAGVQAVSAGVNEADLLRRQGTPHLRQTVTCTPTSNSATLTVVCLCVCVLAPFVLS